MVGAVPLNWLWPGLVVAGRAFGTPGRQCIDHHTGDVVAATGPQGQLGQDLRDLLRRLGAA